MKSDSKSKLCRIWIAPYALSEAIKKDLSHLQQLGVIVNVRYSDWTSENMWWFQSHYYSSFTDWQTPDSLTGRPCRWTQFFKAQLISSISADFARSGIQHMYHYKHPPGFVSVKTLAI